MLVDTHTHTHIHKKVWVGIWRRPLFMTKKIIANILEQQNKAKRRETEPKILKNKIYFESMWNLAHKYLKNFNFKHYAWVKTK